MLKIVRSLKKVKFNRHFTQKSPERSTKKNSITKKKVQKNPVILLTNVLKKLMSLKKVINFFFNLRGILLKKILNEALKKVKSLKKYLNK